MNKLQAQALANGFKEPGGPLPTQFFRRMADGVAVALSVNR